MNDTNVDTHAPKNQEEYSQIKRTLEVFPSVYSTRSIIDQYKKQLVETRTLIYHQQNLRMLAEDELADPEEKRLFVIKRVARELWTNFCVRGYETPMLHHLHTSLRKEYGEDLQFYYLPGSTELIIMKQGENDMVPLERMEQVNLVNRAWQISQDVVNSYTA